MLSKNMLKILSKKLMKINQRKLLLSPKQLRNSAIVQSDTSMLTSVVRVSCWRMLAQFLLPIAIGEFLNCFGDSFIC